MTRRRPSPRLLTLVTVLAALVVLSVGPVGASHRPRPEWKPGLTTTSGDPMYLDLFPGGRGFALQFISGYPEFTAERRSTLFTTADYGKTWTEMAAPEGAYVSDFASPEVGYAFTTDQAGRNTIRTTDGGATWSVLEDPPAELKGADSAGAYFDVLAAPSDQVVLLGGVVSRYWAECRWESRVAVYRSDDGGQSFTWYEFPYGGVVHQLEMLDENHGVMIASEWSRSNDPVECSSQSESIGLHALVTRDGGATWSPIATEPYDFGAPPTERGVHTVGIASPDRLLLGMSNGDILTSHDGGRTFVKALGTGNRVYPTVDGHYLSRIEFIRFANENVGYATSAHGAVWRTRDGGLTWRQERSPQAAGAYSFSSGLAVANPWRGIVAAHTKLSSRLPRH